MICLSKVSTTVQIWDTQVKESAKLKNLLNGKFKIKDLDNAKKIIGMEISRDRAMDTSFLNQEK